MIPRYRLDPRMYFDQEWFDREQTALFTNRWALVASGEEVATPGAFVTADIGRAPVVVVRGHDGALRAFHNICRHRGMALLTGSGQIDRNIACFYHQWRYGLDGSLEVVPQRRDQFPDLELSEWGLLPASIEEWEGMVFVHPDPCAPPLDEALRGVVGHLGSHRPGQLEQVAVRHLSAACNWKLFVENHVDVYHLWHLHQSSLAGFDHTRFEHVQTGPNWASYEPLRGEDGAAAALSPGTEAIRHLDPRDRNGLGAHLVFPSLMIATSATFFATYAAVPVAPDRTTIELRIRAERGADAAELVAAVLSFIDEDIDACEAIQRAVMSPAFRVGPLAVDHERPIEAFQTHLLDAVGNVTGSRA